MGRRKMNKKTKQARPALNFGNENPFRIPLRGMPHNGVNEGAIEYRGGAPCVTVSVGCQLFTLHEVVNDLPGVIRRLTKAFGWGSRASVYTRDITSAQRFVAATAKRLGLPIARCSMRRYTNWTKKVQKREFDNDANRQRTWIAEGRRLARDEAAAATIAASSASAASAAARNRAA